MTAPHVPTSAPAPSAVATLGGGCFWCLDAVYRRLRGVTRVVSGYAGGHVPNPTYEAVCEKTTGHAEVVQVHHDPAVVSYRELLEVFFAMHDPTTPNRQGADVGPQYRSIILTHDDAQRAEAEAVIAELTREAVFDRPIVTQLEPLREFYAAEAYHQDYFARNGRQGYCQVVIAPKVAKLRQKFADRLAA
mgnify:CR=1 FL=1